MIRPIQETPRRLLQVLCAEDQPIYADLVALHFENAGHKVHCVPDGQAAWEAIASDLTRFDLLITDQQMPLLDGASLVSRLRRAGFPGRIIVHAAGLPAEVKGQFERHKVDAIVPKGPESDRLLRLAEGVCDGALQSGPSRGPADQASMHVI